MNIPADADVGALAYGAIYSSYGALTITSLAISMGAASIAGEERKGTMGLLLGNPKSRTHILVSKAANIVLLTALGVVILWAAGIVVPQLLNVDITGVQVGALVFHMCRDRSLPRLPRDGHQLLDGQERVGFGRGRRRDDHLVLRGRAASLVRQSRRRREGVSVVLLRRQRPPGERSRLGSPRRVARRHCDLGDRRRGRGQPTRPAGTGDRRSAWSIDFAPIR